jgi:hypothetical protein
MINGLNNKFNNNLLIFVMLRKELADMGQEEWGTLG